MHQIEVMFFCLISAVCQVMQNYFQYVVLNFLMCVLGKCNAHSYIFKSMVMLARSDSAKFNTCVA